MRDLRTRRGVTVAVGLAFAAAAAGAAATLATGSEATRALANGPELPRAFDRPANGSDALPGDGHPMRHFEPGESRRVAEYVDSRGASTGLYIWKTADGKLTCMTAVRDATGLGGGGCNPAGSFFAGKPFVVSLGYEGGPEPASVSEAVVTGVVSDQVTRIEVANSGGVTTGVELTADGGFVWKARPSDLRAGIGPQFIVAYDENGAELGRESIAISG